MICVIQRTLHAACTVDGETTGTIDRGLVVYAGILNSDTPAHAEAAAAKLAKLRVFPDGEGKMNMALPYLAEEHPNETVGVLLIPNFTLSANPATKGNRPAFTKAAAPDRAEPLYTALWDALAAQGVTVALGRFGADMRIAATAWGPVTLVLDTNDIGALKPPAAEA